jgi:ribonuclease BN (tRNA processing enzyme)
MKLRVLGCSGGIGSSNKTTSFLVDEDVLVDAGTGVGDLTVEELARIDHVFITHSHLDHVACIPFLLDTVASRRSEPLVVHALRQTIQTLRAHLFNWQLWPDFTQIPSLDNPYMRYEALAVGECVGLNGRQFHALPANHVVAACGYRLSSETGSLVFTGDTGRCDALWQEINLISDLRYLIIETAFGNADKELAEASRHLTPAMLAEGLEKLHSWPEVLVTHLKPGEGLATMAEVSSEVHNRQPRMLQQGEILEF